MREEGEGGGGEEGGGQRGDVLAGEEKREEGRPGREPGGVEG